MEKVETKQYCVTVKVWVWAEDANRAEDIAKTEINFYPAAGYAVVEVNEDKEP